MNLRYMYDDRPDSVVCPYSLPPFQSRTGPHEVEVDPDFDPKLEDMECVSCGLRFGLQPTDGTAWVVFDQYDPEF